MPKSFDIENKCATIGQERTLINLSKGLRHSCIIVWIALF